MWVDGGDGYTRPHLEYIVRPAWFPAHLLACGGDMVSGGVKFGHGYLRTSCFCVLKGVGEVVVG